MPRLLAPVLALSVALGAAPALAQDPSSPAGRQLISSQVISDPSIGADCRGAGTAHTPDVAVRGKVVAATWTIGNDAGIGLALSRDHGRSWSRRAAPFGTCTAGPLEYVTDPDLALGADGTPWLSASGNVPADGAVSLSTGDREGRTLVAVGDRAPVSVFPGVTTERGFLETDPTDPSRGWVLAESLTRAFVTVGPGGLPVFVPGGPEGSLLLGRTDDGGRTWTQSTLRSSAPGTSVIALGLVGSGSALVALSVEVDLKDPLVAAGAVAGGFTSARGPVAAQTSTDGGRTWSAPVVLGVVDSATLVDAAAGGGVIAVASAQPDGTVQGWTSEDTGRTWRQSTAATGVDLPGTAVAVDRRGEVSVLSYALSGKGRLVPQAPDALGVDTRMLTPQLTTSTDRGRTWSAALPLATPFAATTRSGSHIDRPFGPYNGADADGHDALVALVADDDGNDATEARLVRVRTLRR